MLTPASSIATPQGSQDMAPAQQDMVSALAQAAGSPRAASSATVPPTNVACPQDSQDMAPAQEDQTPVVAQAAPSTAVATNGLPAQDKAASRQPITSNLGNWSLPQPGDGFVTPSLPGAKAQGNYKTPPSGPKKPEGCGKELMQKLPVYLEGPMGWHASLAGATCQGQDLGRFRVLSLDSVAQQPSPAGTPGDDIRFNTPAADSGLGVHGGSIQSDGGGHMPTALSPGAQDNEGMVTPHLYLPVLTPTSSMATSQGSQDMAPAQQDLVSALAHAAGSPRAVSPATDKASSNSMASFGPTAPAASSTASVAAAGSSAGSAAAPTAIASVEAAEDSTVPTASSPADAGSCASLLPPSAAAARTAGRACLLMGLHSSPAQLAYLESALSTPATGVIPGHGNTLIVPHGGGHMPTALSPGYVIATPNFYLPVLTPLSSTPHSQHSQRFVPHQDSAVAQPASRPRAASPAAGASLIPMAFSGPAAEAPLSRLIPFPMGVDQPNKRAADQTGKKGKPARKAGADIQRTAGASKPAHAMAPSSSSSSSLPLQADPDGPSSDEPRLKRHKPTAAEEEWGQQAPVSRVTPLLVKKKPRGRWLMLEKSKGKKLWWATARSRVRLHLRRKLHQPCHGAACHPSPCWAYSFTEGTAQLKAHRSLRDQPNSAKLKMRGGNVAPFMHAGLLSPEVVLIVFCAGCKDAACCMAADLASASTAGSASGGGADEEAREGTGHTPIVDSLSNSSMAEGCVQHPAMPGAHQDPPAVHVSGPDDSTTAAPIGGTDAELPSDTAREEAHPSGAERARNSRSAIADTRVDSEDALAGHVQDSPASVTHDAAREEAHPSRGGSAGPPSPTAAASRSGDGEGQAHSGSAPASVQEGPCSGPTRKKRQSLDQGAGPTLIRSEHHCVLGYDSEGQEPEWMVPYMAQGSSGHDNMMACHRSVH
ncbi:TPA: hypothetical protein ACH3X1_004247 [Trebouxia sp. C0004]